MCSFNGRLHPRDADSGVVAEVVFSDAKPGICMTLTPSQGSRPSFEKETLVLFDVNLPTLGPHPEIPLPSLRAGLPTDAAKYLLYSRSREKHDDGESEILPNIGG